MGKIKFESKKEFTIISCIFVWMFISLIAWAENEKKQIALNGSWRGEDRSISVEYPVKAYYDALNLYIEGTSHSDITIRVFNGSETVLEEETDPNKNMDLDLFIDKSNQDGKIMLVDASKLGEKRKEGKNQRTVLSEKEVEKIENTFINQEVVEDFSVKVSYEEIQEKNYSLSAGQYFEVKIEYVELSLEEFNQRMAAYSSRLAKCFAEGKRLEEEIEERLGELRYD